MRKYHKITFALLIILLMLVVGCGSKDESIANNRQNDTKLSEDKDSNEYSFAVSVDEFCKNAGLDIKAFNETNEGGIISYTRAIDGIEGELVITANPEGKVTSVSIEDNIYFDFDSNYGIAVAFINSLGVTESIKEAHEDFVEFFNQKTNSKQDSFEQEYDTYVLSCTQSVSRDVGSDSRALLVISANKNSSDAVVQSLSQNSFDVSLLEFCDKTGLLITSFMAEYYDYAEEGIVQTSGDSDYFLWYQCGDFDSGAFLNIYPDEYGRISKVIYDGTWGDEYADLDEVTAIFGALLPEKTSDEIRSELVEMWEEVCFGEYQDLYRFEHESYVYTAESNYTIQLEAVE